MYIHILIELNHFVEQQKLAQHGKSTILQLKKKSNNLIALFQVLSM